MKVRDITCVMGCGAKSVIIVHRSARKCQLIKWDSFDPHKLVRLVEPWKSSSTWNIGDPMKHSNQTRVVGVNRINSKGIKLYRI